MATPETTDIAAPAPQRPTRLQLAWMIISQILSILVIVIAIGFGIFTNLIGGGVLTGGRLNLLEVVTFFSPVFLIPIIASWVVYKKGNFKTAMVLTTVTFFVLFCPCLVAVLLVIFSS